MSVSNGNRIYGGDLAVRSRRELRWGSPVALLLAAVLGAWARPARADVALESYLDRRSPAEERAALERLKRALQGHGVVTKPEQIVERIGVDLALPGYPDREVTRTQVIQRIEKAVNRAAHEAYDEAVTILESVFRDLDRNPALVASDPDSRSWVTKGRVALVFAYARSKQRERAAARDAGCSTGYGRGDRPGQRSVLIGSHG